MSGRPAEIAEATIQSYQQQVAEMLAALQTLQARLHERAEPIGTATLDTVDRWCDIAEADNAPLPMRQACLGLVQKWVAVNERARRVAAGIVIPRGNGARPE